MNQKTIICLLFFVWSITSAWGQYRDTRTHTYLPPVRIVWQNNSDLIQNALLKQGNGQSMLAGQDLCVLTSTTEQYPSILIDFGKEIQLSTSA